MRKTKLGRKAPDQTMYKESLARSASPAQYPFVPKPGKPRFSGKTRVQIHLEELRPGEADTGSPSKVIMPELPSNPTLLMPKEEPSVDLGSDHLGVSNASSILDEFRSSSRLSFIMKERLHSFATDLQRRTEEMRAEVQRPPTPEEVPASAAPKPPTPKPQGADQPASDAQASAQQPKGLARLARKLSGLRFPEAIDPQSGGHLVWLCLLASAFLFNAVAIPLRSSFPYQTAGNLAFWLLADYACDALYLADILLVRPRHTYIRNGLTVSSPTAMRRKYLFSVDLKLDVLSLFPLDLCYIWWGPRVWLRFPRFLKFRVFGRCFAGLEVFVRKAVVLRIAKTLSYMLYVIHVNACVYYAFSAWSGFGALGVEGGLSGVPMAGGPTDEPVLWAPNKWLYANEGMAYVRCFYFTTKLATSIGNNPGPSNVLECGYVTLCWLSGVLVFAVLLGQIRDIVATAAKSRDHFRKAMDAALAEASRLRLPQHLTNRLRSWFIYTWQHQQTLDEEGLLGGLPLKLRSDLAKAVHLETLAKVELFKECEAGLLDQLVLRLRPVLFQPGELVCRKGDVGKEMYIVSSGVVEVVGGPEGKTVFVRLEQGSVFGEVSLLAAAGSNKRTADVRSKGFSNLFLLLKEDLFEALADFPLAQAVLKRKADELRRKSDKRDGRRVSRDLSSLASVSSQIKEPKLLSAVLSVMDPKSPVTHQLQSSVQQPSTSQPIDEE